PLLNYRLSSGPGLDLARVVNEYIAGLCAAAPGRIYGLGTVPLQDPDVAAFELSAVAEAERLGTAIFVHAMPVASDRLPGPATATFGVGVEGSLAAAAIITGGVA